MVLFPNCKINLGLHITRKRQDGYHDLETVFYPLPLKDAIEAIATPLPGTDALQQEGLSFTSSGLAVAGDTTNNLCVKAWRLIKKDYPHIPPIQLYLHKVIPMGAGLGGGSSDGAFTLRLLNDKFRLGIPPEKLLDYALQLGSDCPFFLLNKPSIATGRGELMEPIDLNLSAYDILLVCPEVHINTGWAFSQIIPTLPSQSIRAVLQQPVESWRDRLVNDFEAPVCQLHPSLQDIRDRLYGAGTVYASMTGSGSSFYGLFPKGKVPNDLFPSHKFYILTGS